MITAAYTFLHGTAVLDTQSGPAFHGKGLTWREVTALAGMGNELLSGSKDKALCLWDLRAAGPSRRASHGS